MRQLIVRAALALTLGAVAGTTGCATITPQSEAQADEFAGYAANLQELPGVDEVDLNASSLTATVALSVSLSDDVTPNSLAEIGAAVYEFEREADTRGYVASEPVVRLDESSYSYFDGLTPQQAQAQLAYWLELHREGAESVRMRTFTASTDVPAAGLIGAPPQSVPDPTASAEQTPRYVLVQLPSDAAEAQLRGMIEALAAIDDPGAPDGQWDFLNLAPRTKGEYASPDFPSSAELTYAVATGNHFADVEGLASVQVTRDRGHDTPLRIQIAVFDDAMDGVSSGDAEVAFQTTEAWAKLLDLVSLLETAGSLDYAVEVLATPLSDGGNFTLKFGVHGCEFTADSSWPALADALTGAWVEHVSDERFEADSSCERPGGGGDSGADDAAGDSSGQPESGEDSEPAEGGAP